MNRTHYIYNIVALLLLLGAATTTHAQTIRGNIYGGGEMAKVDGNTNVELKTGAVEKDVFGGGEGTLKPDNTPNMSADVSGTAKVIASGTTFTFTEDAEYRKINHNIYGGGNQACVVNASEVTINAGLREAGFLDGGDDSAWSKWKDAVTTEDDNVVKFSVFGGGYGVNTIVTTTATVSVNVPDGDAKPDNTAMVDVVGGGYNGYVLSKTSVTVEGVPEIYKIYGGGLGSRDGYTKSPTTTRNHANLTAYTMQQTIGSVGEGKDGDGTNVLIKGGKFYNDIFGGGAGLKYNGGTSYLNVAEVFGTTTVVVDAPSWIDGNKFSKNIYGGGALGLVSDDIYVTLKSGEFAGAQVFGGSLGEIEHPDDKAKVGGNTHVLVTKNTTTPTPDALKGHLDIYGGCDMAWVDNTAPEKGNTDVKVEYGTFYGSIFGAGKGIPSTDADNLNADHGKVTGNTNVIIDGGADWEMLTLGAADKYTAGEASAANEANHISEGQPGYVREGEYKTPIKVYGGSALGLIGGTLDVKLKSGTLYGEMFGGSLGELGYEEKAKVTTTATISTVAGSNDPETEKPYPLNGLFNIYGGCDMAQLQGNTNVNLQHGTFSGNIFGGGKGVKELSTTEADHEQYLNYGKVIGQTSIVLDAPEIVLGEDDIRDTDGNITELKPKVGIYGGGALGMVEGTINPVTLKSGTLYGSIFGGSLGEKGHLAKAKVTGNTSVVTAPNDTKDSDGETPKPDALTGIFNIYGGCDLAWVEGNTTVTIGHGDFSGKIFGGGKGVAYAEAGGVTGYGMINGVTEVNYESDGSFNGDIYGGGALGLVTPNGTPEYTTQVNLSRGEINGQIFGGGYGETTGYDSKDNNTWGVLNTAKVTGNTKVETTGTEDLTGEINHVYGGGDMAMVYGNTKVKITHGTFSGTIFGGGHGVASVGEEEYMDFGKVTGTTNVLIDGPNLELGADYETSPMKIYGGGALGIVEGNITVKVCSGTIKGAVFAGSLGEEGHVNKAKVTTNAQISTEGSDENFKPDTTIPADLNGQMDIYGACDMAQFVGNAHVDIKHGDFTGRIFGGGKGLATKIIDGVDTNKDYGKVIGKSDVLYDSDGTFTGSIYGGGALGLVEHPSTFEQPAEKTDPEYYITKVRLKKGTINDGFVFGGSLGENTNPAKAMINGNTLVVTEEVSDPETEILSGNINHVYGGGDMAQVTGDTEVKITHGSFTGDIYGGGNGRVADSNGDNIELGKVIGNSLVTIDGTSIELGEIDGEKINVYGGGALGIVTTDATVNMENGTVVGTIYGGSFGEEGYAEKAIIQNNTNVNINGGTITGDVFGGGALAKVDKDTHVNINGGSVSNEVYGGGALADVNQDTHVYLFGGTVHDVYGGGLGQLASAAVEESGTKGAPGYVAPVPAKPAIEAFVKRNTLVQLGKLDTPGDTSDNPARSASKVTGSIFGCNNVNGTPKGHAKVHVIKTESRTDQAAEHNAADVENSYDVLAVYGGGNKAAYQPTADNEKAEVLIEYCNNSIAYVYGGGNAAPVSGTEVKIYGANAIDHAFAGGNGKGVGNKGADVGYLNFYSQGSREKYGSGLASISVYGGTVHNVYGGSNTLGYIRTSSSVNVSDPVADDPYDHGCDLVVGKTFGGGNEADIVGNIEMCLSCTAGADIVFAGANNANVYGDIHLTIQSGTFRQVFCSNNQGGAVFGKLQLDVDETGCTPVIIKELFGGGNLAPYSIYGYKKNGEGKYEPLTSKAQFDALTDAEKTEQKFVDGKPYDDPVVNVYSCTAIGTVYGGGFGESAKVYGNPIVNVDMVKGEIFAGRTLNSTTYDKPIMVIKNGIIQTVPEITIPDDIGTIGNIFGGGKLADVYGNTTVNVCVNHPEKSALISPFQGDVMTKIMSFSDADRTANDEPKGNVYGGGKMANVYGNTKVHIRNGNIEGNVFGAGQGDASQPDAALVKGKTEVIIGEE